MICFRAGWSYPDLMATPADVVERLLIRWAEEDQKKKETGLTPDP